MSQSSKVLKEVGELKAGKVSYGSAETIVGAGSGKQEISLDTVVTLLDNNATADLYLGKPGVSGQGTMKILICTDASAAATLDNGDVEGGMIPNSSLVFDSTGDSATLVYSGTKWYVINNNIA